MTNKFNSIIILCLLSFIIYTKTMEYVPREVAWAWVNTWYKDRSKEVNQACAQVNEMIKEMPRISVGSEFTKEKNELVRRLNQSAKLCKKRDKVKRIQAIDQDPVGEKYLRKIDKMLSRELENEKRVFDLLKE